MSGHKNDIWELIKRKYMENLEFRRHVNEGLMRHGGDESLNVVAEAEQCGDFSRFYIHAYQSHSLS